MTTSSSTKAVLCGVTKAAELVKAAVLTAVTKPKKVKQAKKAENPVRAKDEAASVTATVPATSLAAAGFVPWGTLKNSAASRKQSKIGNVPARSLFAALQSAAAGGYGVAATLTRTSVVFNAASVAITTTWFKDNKRKKDDKANKANKAKSRGDGNNADKKADE